jgi:hypothetical protein
MEVYDDMPPAVLEFYKANQIPFHRRQKIT